MEQQTPSLFQQGSRNLKRRGVAVVSFSMEDAKRFQSIFEETIQTYANRLEKMLTDEIKATIRKNVFSMYNFHLGAFSFGDKGVFSLDGDFDVEVHYKIRYDENMTPSYLLFHKSFATGQFDSVQEMKEYIKEQLFDDFKVAVKYATLGTLQ